MSCCKPTQVHRPYETTFQFCNPNASAAGGTENEGNGGGLPQLEGCADYLDNIRTESHNFIDNEGDWKRLSDYAGIDMNGNLWCWMPAIATIHSFRDGTQSILGPGYGCAPFLMSDSGDWKFVASNESRGYAIKDDGTLWGFGDNSYGNLGISRLGAHSSGLGNYRARLSAGIQSIGKVTYCPQSLSKVTQCKIESIPIFFAEGNAYTSGDTGGAGAQVLAKWTGRARGIYLTSGGAGYTSRPTVVLKGVGADSGKLLAATSVRMTQSLVQSITVTNPGSGYTYAKATILLTGTTADAVIVNGMVASWTLTDPGRLTNVDEQSSFSVTVIGDGYGAIAGFTVAPRSIAELSDSSFPATAKMWTEKPIVEISGGGGSGASAQVGYIIGTVDEVELLSPGSGYTQGRYTRLQVMVAEEGGEFYAIQADVNLTPSVVASTEAVPGKNPVAAKAHSGAVLPFACSKNALNPIYSPVKPSGFTLEPGGIGLEEDADNFYLASTIFGFQYPPFARGLWSADVPNQEVFPEWEDTSGIYSITYFPGDDPCDPCRLLSRFPCENHARWWVRDSIVASLWPMREDYSTQDIDYACVDGSFWVASTGAAREVYNGPECEYSYTHPAVTLPYYTDPIWRRTVSCVDLYVNTGHAFSSNAYFTNAPFESRWYPPSAGEQVRLYFEPPSKYGGTQPRAFCSPSGGDWRMGSASSVALQTSGTGLYDYEPEVYSVGNAIIEDPVQLTGPWVSVSVSGEMTLGVQTDGRLYWWGRGTANKSAPCPFPSPVGQGAALLCENISLRGKRGMTGGGHRVDIDIPQHGARIATNTNSLQDLSDPSAPGYTFSGTEFQKAAGFGKGIEYLPNPNPDFLLKLAGYGKICGAGYEEAPQVWVTEIGSPVATFSTRLLGPTQFEKVQDGFAMGADGSWYDVSRAGEDTIAELPTIVNSYKWTFTQAAGDCPSPDLDLSSGMSSELTGSVVLYPARVRVTRGGGGYSSAAITIDGIAANVVEYVGSDFSGGECTEGECPDTYPPFFYYTCTERQWTYTFGISGARTSTFLGAPISSGVVTPYTTNTFWC